jgi:hypothetical protein
MSKRPAGDGTPASRLMGRWALRVLLVVVPIALLGEVGHQLLRGHDLAHHLFHILFLGGAVGGFAAYAIVDIRRHGVPSFRWQLREPDVVDTAPAERDGSR